MLNNAILIKIDLRLNKLASSDYDNVESWKKVEAFNKGQVDWCRRNLHGLNSVREGDEQSTSRIDDLEILLTSYPPIMTKHSSYYETNTLPDNYLRWKRVSVKAKNDCCTEKRNMVIYLSEEGNVDITLRDKNKQPNFEWGETFATVIDGKIRVYTNGLFDITDVNLVYYRQPRKIEVIGIVDLYTGLTPTVEVTSEFKDDLIELFIDEAVKILSGDIEAQIQVQREGQSVETNN